MTQIANNDLALVARLRDRDEQAFAAVVDAYTPAMLRVARNYVATQELAEDVVQETWIGVVKGIGNLRAAAR